MLGMNILIADDHAVLRRGLRQILAEGMPDVSCEEAGDGEELARKLDARRTDVLLLDISMPGRNGLELLLRVKDKHPDTAVLVVSVHPEQQYALRAIRAGADGYLTKDVAHERLVDAVHKVATGGRFVSPAVAELLAQEVATAGTEKPPHELLSNREDAIFRRLAAGQSVGQIAKTIDLSVKTVSTYRARVLAKMKMKTNAELMRYAMDHKLVD